jgi:predicted DNA-binding transcriptional regulator YafY
MVRADRLISILMLLQARGRMTAQTLAEELEVSERTIYRDVDALSLAGAPIYCESGPGGGIGLLDEYRTSLTGLTDGEVRALFAVSLPDALPALAVRDDLRSALRKLAAALPAASRSPDVLLAEVHIDPTGWGQGEEATPHLPLLHQAIRQRRRVVLRYRRFAGHVLEATVDPLGLAAKAGVWHLVYAQSGRVRVQPLANVLDAHLSDAAFSPPPGFDLRRAWQEHCADAEAQRQLYLVTLRLTAAARTMLRQRFSGALRSRLDAAPVDDQGWATVELAFDSLESARSALLALGGGVEVLAPEPLRRSIVDYAQEIIRRYESA